MTLVPLPSEGADEFVVYPSDGSPGEFAVDVPLWTAEEGRTDLTLSLTVVDDGDSAEVSIYDVHVLQPARSTGALAIGAGAVIAVADAARGPVPRRRRRGQFS
jgi:hypothetical protein